MIRSFSGLVSLGGKKVPASAAFPSGLPEELLEASVASQPFSEGSDSDQSSKSTSSTLLNIVLI